MVYQSHIKGPSRSSRGVRGFTLVEMMFSVGITGFVFAGVISSYLFLARGLAKNAYNMDLESRSRLALRCIRDDVTAATAVENGFGIWPAPNSSSFTVDVAIGVQPYLASPPAPANSPSSHVIGTATYTYDATTQQLTVVRRPPVSASTLANPIWATQDFGQPDRPLVLLRGVQGITFAYLNGEYVTAPNTISIKVVSIGFSTQAPYLDPNSTFNSEVKGNLTQVTQVMMVNKGLLQ